MSIEKKYLKTKPVCKVKFSLSGDAYAGVASIQWVGDFNGWSLTETPFKKSRESVWSVTLDFDTGKSYGFRYLLDGAIWENDANADRFLPNDLGSENAVIDL